MTNIVKIIFLVLIFANLHTINTMSAPAKKVWKNIVLSNGMVVEAKLIGDEHGHWYTDQNGKCISINEDGTGVYISEQKLNEIKGIRNNRTEKISLLREKRLKKHKESNIRTRRIGTRAGDRTQKGLVILVDFADKSMSSDNINSSISRMFNEKGYNENNHVGSVHDYFYDQSYGQFNLNFDIIGPVTVSHPMSYYGANDATGNDSHPAEMVIEAVNLADKLVNYKDYDWDGDGEVEQVLIIYAGYGENEGAPTSTLWPHEWTLESAEYWEDGNGLQTLDEVKIDTYAIINELTGISGKRLTGIGTACHEFSHCLGLPDFYSTGNSEAIGMTFWDVMDSGSYNGKTDNGEQPVEYTSYERWAVGWLTPIVLDKPGIIENMPALCKEPTAYIIYNNGHKNEYYMLENKQSDKWVPVNSNGEPTGHGMLVLHVDYDANIWWKNQVNNDPSHQRMTYIPADNSFYEYNSSYNTYVYTLSGDLFPGSSNKTALTDETTPAMSLHNKNSNGRYYMGKSITDISEARDGSISFTFMNGIGSPEELEVKDITADGFTASWKKVEGALSYNVMAVPYEEGNMAASVLLSEAFNKATTNSNKALTSDQFDTYTDNPGWQGNNIYQWTGALKLGASSKTGVLYTPALVPSSGSITMYASAIAHRAGEENVTVSLVNANTGVSIDGTFKPIQFSASDTTVNVITFNCDRACKICFIADKRIYLTQVDVYDGEYTKDDIANQKLSQNKAAHRIQSTQSNGTIIAEEITDTQYTFTGLTAPQYKVSVQAVGAKYTSDWCDIMIVSMNPAGIESIGHNNMVAADDKIYSISGQYVGKETGKLPAGIYIRGKKKFVVK